MVFLRVSLTSSLLLFSLYTFSQEYNRNFLIKSKLYCSAMSLDVVEKMKLEDLVKYIQKKTIKSCVSNFVNLEFGHNKSLNKIGVKNYLSLFLVSSYPIEMLSLINVSSVNLSRKAKNVISNHRKFCHFINSLDSNGLDYEDGSNALQLFYKLRDSAQSYEKLFIKYNERNSKELLDRLIEKYIHIELTYLKSCNKKESLHIDLLNLYAKQLEKIEQEIGKVFGDSGLASLRKERTKIRKTFSVIDHSYLEILKEFSQSILKQKLLATSDIYHKGELTHKYNELLAQSKIISIKELLLLLRDKMQTFKPLKREVSLEIEQEFSNEIIEAMSHELFGHLSQRTLRFVIKKMELWGSENLLSSLNDLIDPKFEEKSFIKIMLFLESKLDQLHVAYLASTESLLGQRFKLEWERDLFNSAYDQFTVSLLQTKKWINELYDRSSDLDLSSEDYNSPKVFEIFLIKSFSRLLLPDSILDLESLPELMLFHTNQINEIKNHLRVIAIKSRLFAIFCELLKQNKVVLNSKISEQFDLIFWDSLSKTDSELTKNVAMLLGSVIYRGGQKKIKIDSYIPLVERLACSKHMINLINKRIVGYLELNLTKGTLEYDTNRLVGSIFRKDIVMVSKKISNLIKRIIFVHHDRLNQLLKDKLYRNDFKILSSSVTVNQSDFKHFTDSEFLLLKDINSKINGLSLFVHGLIVIYRSIDLSHLDFSDTRVLSEKFRSILSKYDLNNVLNQPDLDSRVIKVILKKIVYDLSEEFYFINGSRKVCLNAGEVEKIANKISTLSFHDIGCKYLRRYYLQVIKKSLVYNRTQIKFDSFANFFVVPTNKIIKDFNRLLARNSKHLGARPGFHKGLFTPLPKLKAGFK